MYGVMGDLKDKMGVGLFISNCFAYYFVSFKKIEALIFITIIFYI
ncbi:hypothetical protein HMPREF0495_02211 [Levilactobacillus brevis ATCC 14869 = DSM 20054]|uniref:Uncharacterized protein n=1 Tax=Levilactobacillus brevis ATCC 14869 = DSM 20054 TaxID=649758 RepID=U2QRU1_LEVBR|nr:hypothetical protein HMPREF0495_02211 [Levilactobacillus brevis ATCC 14869 = DSM 20054]